MRTILSEESEQKTLTGSKIQEEINTGCVNRSEQNQEKERIRDLRRDKTMNTNTSNKMTMRYMTHERKMTMKSSE